MKKTRYRKKLKIAIIMGGKSSEHEVSLKSGRSVLENLDKRKYIPLPILITKKGVWQTKKTKNTIDTLKILQKTDAVIIMLHGPFGEDGTVQGLLELFDLPYVGAGVFTSALCMNKIKTKEIMKANKILTPDYVNFLKIEWQKNKEKILKQITKKLGFPNVVKPNNLGSSIGISIPKNKRQLQKAINLALKYSNQILVEDYIKGKEIHCGVIGNEKPLALPLDEVKPKREFYDYKAKYKPGMSEHLTPAPLSLELTKKIQKQALEIYKLVEGDGLARIDFLIQKNKVYFNEVNTIPGFTKTSILPKEAEIAGISFPRFLDLLIGYALEKHRV
ncbi:MAG: D-alanine--D-alanine ligase family protein [Patescibacteria group bacterium]